MGLSKQSTIGMPEDFPIEDATEEIEVYITSNDITRGKQNDPEQCAFARAERRVDSELVRVAALKTTLYLIYPEYAVRYTLSSAARNAIHEFDDVTGKKMKPGTYVLRPFSENHVTGKGPRNRSKTPGKPYVERRSAWIRGKAGG